LPANACDVKGARLSTPDGIDTADRPAGGKMTLKN